MLKVFFSISLAAFAASASAQCFDQAYGTSLGSGGDFMYPMMPIGFAFPFCGTTYTDIHITTKGYVHLSNAGVPPNPGYADITADPLDLVAGPPVITALWSDIQCNAPGQVYTKSTPTTFTITWKDAQCYAASSGIFDMQMQLSSSGTIKLLFGPGTTNSSTSPAWWAGLVGVSPGTGTLPASVDVSAGGATANNIMFEAFPAQNSFDMPNNGLLLIPTNPGWVYLPLGGPTNCATAANYGTGCINAYDSVQEYMLSSAFDLSNATLTYLRTPTGYVLFNSIPGTFVTPSGSAAIVANGDDIEQTVALASPMLVAGGTTQSLTICSNGRVALSATGNGTSWTPDIGTFLGFASTVFAADWHDYNPTIAGSGSITFEQVGGIAYVTWNGVYSYATTTPSTFQYQFNLVTGDCTIVYGTCGMTGNDHLVGYSVGGPSLSNLPVDMSALTSPVTINDVGVTPLALTNSNAPYLGNPAFTLTASNVPPILPIGFMFFGDTAINPGVDLSFIGMAGCQAYTNANLGSVNFPVAGGSGSVSFPIPNSPSLVGASMSAQALAFSTATTLGLVSSNGNLFTVGN